MAQEVEVVGHLEEMVVEVKVQLLIIIQVLKVEQIPVAVAAEVISPQLFVVLVVLVI